MMSLATSTPQISHANIAAFAAEKVNLRRENATTYREQVNRLREKLDKFIKEHPDLGLIKMLLSGSLAKGTSLKTLNDIDVAVYIDGETAPDSEAEVLRWLADKLRSAYPQMSYDQISPGDHAVRISFRGSGLDVDVVPVYYYGDTDDRGFVYSRSTGKRIMTSVPLHIKFIRDRKQKQPNHYAQVIRLMKWWVNQKKKDHDDFKLKSFIVELAVSHLADSGSDMSSYPDALEALFAYLKKTNFEERIAFSDNYKLSALPTSTNDAIEAFDPVNPENNAASDYTTSRRQCIVDLAEEALDALSYARVATTKGEAIECWQEILGPSFRG